MDANRKLHAHRQRSKRPAVRVSAEDLDSVIADWPGLGRPLQLETEVEILAAFVDRRLAPRYLAQAA